MGSTQKTVIIELIELKSWIRLSAAIHSKSKEDIRLWPSNEMGRIKEKTNKKTSHKLAFHFLATRHDGSYPSSL